MRFLFILPMLLLVVATAVGADDVAIWRVNGLSLGLDDSDLEVRSYVVHQLASQGPNAALLTRPETARTVELLFSSNVRLHVRHALEATAACSQLAEHSQDALRRILRSNDADLMALAARSLAKAKLIRPDDAEPLEKALHTYFWSKTSDDYLNALQQGGLLTQAHGRTIASLFNKTPISREEKNITEELLRYHLLNQEDTDFLENLLTKLDPNTDPYRFLDVAEAVVSAKGELGDTDLAKLEQMLDGDNMALQQGASAVIRKANPACRAKIVAFLNSILTFENIKDWGKISYSIGFMNAGSEVDLRGIDRFLADDSGDRQKTIALELLLNMGAVRPDHRAAAERIVSGPPSHATITGANALAAMGAPSSTYSHQLTAFLSGDDADLALSALAMLSKQKLLTPNEIPALSSRIQHGRAADAATYAHSICELGTLPAACAIGSSRQEPLVPSRCLAANYSTTRRGIHHSCHTWQKPKDNMRLECFNE